jgi:hypothetical protein
MVSKIMQTNLDKFFCYVCQRDLKSKELLGEHYTTESHRKTFDIVFERIESSMQNSAESTDNQSAGPAQKIHEITVTIPRPTSKKKKPNQQSLKQNQPDQPVQEIKVTIPRPKSKKKMPGHQYVYSNQNRDPRLMELLQRLKINNPRKQFLNITGRNISCELCNIDFRLNYHNAFHHFSGIKHKNKLLVRSRMGKKSKNDHRFIVY